MSDHNPRRRNRKPANRRYAAHWNEHPHGEGYNPYRNGYPALTPATPERTPQSRIGRTDHLDKSLHGWQCTSLLADRAIGARIGNDFTQGHRGMSKAVRGAKKFVRTRVRFHENQATRNLSKTLE